VVGLGPFPWAKGNGEWQQCARGCFGGVFVLGAGDTSFHVVADVGGHVLPPIGAFDKFVGP